MMSANIRLQGRRLLPVRAEAFLRPLFFLPSETKPEKTSALNNLGYLRKKPASSSFEIQNRDNLLVSHSERERRLHKTKQRVSVEGDLIFKHKTCNRPTLYNLFNASVCALRHQMATSFIEIRSRV